MQPSDLLRPTPAGLYCPPGEFYIDPVRPVRDVLTIVLIIRVFRIGIHHDGSGVVSLRHGLEMGRRRMGQGERGILNRRRWCRRR